MSERPSTQDIEIGRKILRNWCRDNNLAIDPVAASDLVQKIAETIAVMSRSLVGSPHKVGKYTADYSPIPPEEIAKRDDALAELEANSRPLNRTPRD